MRLLRFTPLIVLAVLAGCQSLGLPRAGNAISPASQASYFDPAPRPPSESPQLPTLRELPLVVEELPAAERSQAADSSDGQTSPPHAADEPLSLLDAAALALTQNPDLIAARQAEGVSLGALGVAETYPFNPSVQVQLTPDPRLQDGSIGSSAHYVLLMQTLQLAHQKRYRESAAQSFLNGTRWNIVQAELQAVAQAERLFFLALYQRGLRDILRSNANLSREVWHISEKQLAAGALSKSDVAIARLDEAAARRRAELGEANFQTALLDLRRHLGYPIQQPLELRADLADYQFSSVSHAAEMNQSGEEELPSNDLHEMSYQLATNRPDVLAAQSDLDASRANLNLAHANRVPDLQIGPYYQRTDGGATLWGFRAQSDLPVLNTGRPLARQRAAELHQRQTIWQQLRARAALEAQAAIDRYERARRMNVASGSSVELPEELSKLEAQFQAGEIDILRIVTARTSLLAAKQSQLDILHELAQSAASLTAFTGLPPEVVVQVRPER
ncbi:MAG: TolC family protein [Pirellulaceae bacterium]|nr:TolC family protein [Pirellulaceae bacterium]